MKYKNKNYYFALILIFLSNATMVLILFFNSNMTDAAINKDINKFAISTILAIISMLIVSILNYFMKKEQNTYKYNYAINLRNLFFENTIINEEISSNKTQKSALSQLTNDTDYILSNGVDQNFVRVNSLLGFILPLVGASIIHISFILIFPLSAFISLIILKSSSEKIKDLSVARSNSYNGYVNSMSNLLEGFATLKLYNSYKLVYEKFSTSQLDMENKKLNLSNSIGFYETLIMLGMVLSQLVYILNAVFLVLENKISPGNIVALMGMAQSFFQSMNTFVQTNIHIESTKPVIENILNKASQNENDDFIDKYEFEKNIVIDKLTFSFPSKEVFNNFSYKFNKSGKYLIKGESGKGKTTLLKLITKQIKNYDGDIFYDGINLKKLSDNSIKNMIAYINQDVFILDDTLKNNIVLASDFDPKKLDKALYLSNLDLLDYDSMISNSNISGGQKQRIAIARAIYYDKPIIIFDEALKGLDKDNLLRIEKNLLSLEDVTLIMVSHNEIYFKDMYTDIIEL